MIDNRIQADARLAEALGLLDEVSLVLLRVGEGDDNLEALQVQLRDFIGDTDSLPIAEVVQHAQDYRLAVSCYGFNPANSVVAMAWADLMTSLTAVFEEE